MRAPELRLRLRVIGPLLELQPVGRNRFIAPLQAFVSTVDVLNPRQRRNALRLLRPTCCLSSVGRFVTPAPRQKPLQSITSSALTSSDGGIVRPNVFAVR
jgi:hypothetical protein